ncbi:hypothetical protein PFDG_01206 [Plasmodium falciparum Dd2]|uniref:Cyclic nucleotide-binding domain-containing protein n=1 Tax=Plasmodium falciparum (isolate Dd2) TaxID=57267 RepID=A0A0L7LYQ1_PLAF4|nr:hypothetical protein PFDG_01206 [Plasmodium falciparum Dd2]
MKDKETFLKNIKYEKCPKGKYIILEGDYCEYFYFIKQGQISIQKFNQHKNMYDEFVTYNENQYFGHQLILNNIKAFFIAVAITDTELYTLEASLFVEFLSPFMDMLNIINDINQIDVLSENVKNDFQKKKQDKNYILKVLKFLKKVNIIQKLDNDTLYNASKNFTLQFFKKGQAIIKYQDKPDFFYIIKKGIVTVKTDFKEDTNQCVTNQKGVEEKINEEENILTDKINKTKSFYLYKYDYFGELSIINEQLRTTRCEAHTNCFLLAIDKISFIKNFSILFNDLLQEADIKYTRSYSLPPWLKSMYGNNFNTNMNSLSIKIPDSASSFSSISEDSSDVFSFEKEINEKLKEEKKKKRKGK